MKGPGVDIRGFVSSLHISLSNALFALAAAVCSYILIHGVLRCSASAWDA